MRDRPMASLAIRFGLARTVKHRPGRVKDRLRRGRGLHGETSDPTGGLVGASKSVWRTRGSLTAAELVRFLEPFETRAPADEEMDATRTNR